MTERSATAKAHPNIALIKYWGNRDDVLRLPANGSISFNLEALTTRTTVIWTSVPETQRHMLMINNIPIPTPGSRRVGAFLDLVREMAGLDLHAEVISENNFPHGAGIASSASAFAALALAATKAAGLELNEAMLSRLARRGSGSACRSVPGGYVEWYVGESDLDSYASTIAPASHWDLMDCIAITSATHKAIGSTEGHARAHTSSIQASRVADTPRRLAICRNAILQRDFEALAEITEYDSRLLHAVMMTSSPPLFYRLNATLRAITHVQAARKAGLPACTTVDAGPNVHVICEASAISEVESLLRSIPGVDEVRSTRVGGPAALE